MFRRKKEKEFIRKTFSKFVDEETVDDILEGKTEITQFKDCTVNYLFVQINDENLDKAIKNISEVCDIIFENDGLVQEISGSLIFSTFGFPIVEATSDLDILIKTKNNVLQSLGKNVKIIYGIRDGKVGNLGSDFRMNYGTIFENYGQVVSNIFDLSYGEAKEI